MMKRNFQSNLIKVKNKQYFGAAQNVKLFYKDQFLTDIIFAYYIEPFFSLFEEKSFIELITEEGGFLDSRQEMLVNNKTIYYAISNQTYSFLKINEINKRYKTYHVFTSSLDFIYELIPSDNLRFKYQKLNSIIYKEILLKEGKIISNSFREELEKNNGDYYNINRSLVGHIPKEITINLFPFFQEEELNEIIIKFNNLKNKPECFERGGFINDLEEYRKFLLDFYGEKGNYCKYTNFNEDFLKPYKSKEELMYVDMVLGGKHVAQSNTKDGHYPFYSCLDSSGWLIIKKIVESLGKI